MTEPTPTPEGGAPTPEPKPAEKKLEFTQEELDEKFAARQKRGEEAAAKRFQKQIDDLNAQIEEFKGKDLGELERLQKKVEKLTKEVSDKDTELTGLRLKDAKVSALLASGATSEQIPKLLKRVSGTTEEEIASDVAELKELGWIGQAKDPEPQKGAKGAGHQIPKDPPNVKTFTRKQLSSMPPEEYEKNRDDIMKAMEAGKITEG